MCLRLFCGLYDVHDLRTPYMECIHVITWMDSASRNYTSLLHANESAKDAKSPSGNGDKIVSRNDAFTRPVACYALSPIFPQKSPTFPSKSPTCVLT